MMANQAAVLHAPHDIRIEERTIPTPGPKEVLVEVKAVGVCGSDVHWYEHGRIGALVVRAPLVLGHEVSGVVVELGAEVRKHSVGERVALEPGIPCGACRECRAGRYNLCPDVRFFGTPPIDGAFANYVTIHEDFAFTLPDQLSFDAGALIEPLAVGIWACRKARLAGGDHVLVTGAGPIGLLAMQTALALGAAHVTITDLNPRRLEVARQTGATRALNVAEMALADTDIEADVLIECTGHPQVLLDGIRALRPASRAVIVGMGPSDEMLVPMSFIQRREIWLTGTFRYANTYPAAIALAAAGRVNLDAIVTGYYGLQETERALEAGRHDAGSIKAMVLPNG
jgi:L-iditol 2-dehydrogenase